MAPPHSSSTFAVLRHKHFRNVWIAAFISSMGGWMEIVGVQWAMAQATLADAWVNGDRPGATIMMAYLAAAQLLPQLFLGVVGGVLADVVDRKKLLLITQSARMVVAIALCVLAFQGVINPWLLILLLLNRIFPPARAGEKPRSSNCPGPDLMPCVKLFFTGLVFPLNASSRRAQACAK